MGEIVTSYRQISSFYSSKSVRAKQMLACAKTQSLPILAMDIIKIKSKTQTDWV